MVENVYIQFSLGHSGYLHFLDMGVTKVMISIFKLRQYFSAREGYP